MKQIAIVGGGIVGSTAAYYLTRAGYHVTLFDEGTGQATKAAAGIICPWFSQRRNKPWYHLVSKGAEFYHQLIADLSSDSFDVANIFEEQGTLLIRKSEKALNRDQKAAEEKRKDSPAIQEVKTVWNDNLKDYCPLLETDLNATFVTGGARVDGFVLINTLHAAIQKLGATVYYETTKLVSPETLYSPSLGQKQYQAILLAAGAWLPNLLNPLGYTVDIRPQKGQLYTIHNDQWQNNQWPVIMPPGKIDIIPNKKGEIVLGATHEDDQGFDLSVDASKLKKLTAEAKLWIPTIDQYQIKSTRVGTRAYTSDYSVLVGQVPETHTLWAISGLGSSGLTSGPYLGYQWSQLIMNGQWDINPNDYPIEKYITK